MTAALAATLASAAVAQEAESPAPAGFGVGLAAAYTTFSEDFEGLDGGFGGDATLRYTFDDGLQLLGGAHYSVHSIERLPSRVGYWVFYFDPRYVIELFESQRVVLLVAGRVGYVSLSTTDESNVSTSGVTVGGSVGGLYGLRRTLAVEVTFYFGGIWTNRLQEQPDAESVTGSSSAINIGIVWSFPN
jgi:hypothetical protein